jgi:hypothetical protein
MVSGSEAWGNPDRPIAIFLYLVGGLAGEPDRTEAIDCDAEFTQKKF